MKIRKSIVLLLVCIAFAVICCACSETSGENPGQDSADNSSVTETIRIDVNQYTMNIGDSVKITADKECSWSVSDAGVVSVNDKGLVTAVGLGQANVVAEYKGAKDTCVITVTDELLGEPDLSINIKSERLIVNETTEVFPIAVFGSKVADNSVLDYRVTSSDSSVISVNGFKLKGEREGNATVKVELTYKGKNYSVNKNVTVKEVSDIWFEKEEISAIAGSDVALELKGVFSKENAINDVTYDISDESVLKFENGKFSAIKTGTAVVTASYEDVTAKCVVRVCNIISTTKEFLKIYDDLSANYIIMSDIDLSGVFLNDYINNFSGYIDGNGFAVTGITFNQWQSCLFYRMSGTIKNVNFKSACFGGDNPLILSGLIADTLEGATIENCRFDVTFNNVGSGNYPWANYAMWGMYAGVIAAYNDNAVIKDCYISVKTPNNSKNDYIGAVVGYNRGDLTLDNVIIEKTGDLDYCVIAYGVTSKLNGTGFYNKAAAGKVAELDFNSAYWKTEDETITLKNNITYFDNIASYRVITELKNLDNDGYTQFSSENRICLRDATVIIDPPEDEIYGFTFDSAASVLSAVVDNDNVNLYYRYKRNEYTVKLTCGNKTESKKYLYEQECDTSKDFSLNPPEVIGKMFIGYGDHASEIFEVTEDFEGQAVYATPISTVEQFLAIKNDLSGNYVLTASLDFEGVDYEMVEGDFSGILDGDGYSIKNLRLEKLKDDGIWNHTTALFGRVSGTIKEIAFENATIYVENNLVQCGLIGSVFTGYADSVYADINIPRTYYQWNTQQSGGLFGTIGGAVVKNCFITCRTDGAYTTGSIAGVVVGDVLIDRVIISSNGSTNVFAVLDGGQKVNRKLCFTDKQAQSTIWSLLIDGKQEIIENAANVLSSTWFCDGVQIPLLKNMQKMEKCEVSDFAQFVSVMREKPNAYIVLTDDLTYDKTLVSPLTIGNFTVRVIASNFTGIIDGQGHKISTVYLSPTGVDNSLDMCMVLNFSGTIKNIEFEAAVYNPSEQLDPSGVIAREFSGVAENIKLTYTAYQLFTQGWDTQQSGGLFGRLANGALIKDVFIDFSSNGNDYNVAHFGYLAGFVKENASVTIKNVVVLNRGSAVRPMVALVYDTSSINGIKPSTTTRFYGSDEIASYMNETIITDAFVGSEESVIANAGNYLGDAWVCDGKAIPYLKEN